ncbi:MAG: acyl-homoserine-lactone synthase [Paracoccaceae bacterium]|uniref:acyl-homoserine-lactone synthase n=1 Tax=Sulfitobacter pontiacus TaxID=60137 RepID=UPI0032797DFE
MLRYLTADQLANFPRLCETMFKDRAVQFHDRLGWEVEVDETGSERDSYDTQNPLYIIWERPDGTHGGSLRLLPTTGDHMLADHFLNLTDGVRIESPLIWECTRFCLAPEAEATTSSALMLGVLEIGLQEGLSHVAGVFDARMIRVYRRVGWGPTILGSDGVGRDAISAGLWPCENEYRARLLGRAGVSDELSRYWLMRSFDAYRVAA